VLFSTQPGKTKGNNKCLLVSSYGEVREMAWRLCHCNTCSSYL